MTEELGSIEMFRNDFINNFSHEFKTPIVSIRGFARQLQNKDLSDEKGGNIPKLLYLNPKGSLICLLMYYSLQNLKTSSM